MPNLARIKLPYPIRLAIPSASRRPALMVLSVLILVPLAAHAQGSPFDTGFNAIQKPDDCEPYERGGQQSGTAVVASGVDLVAQVQSAGGYTI